MTDAGDRQSRSLPHDTLVYLGTSMYPTLRNLDLIRYERNRTVRAGDVIAFPEPGTGRIIVHRVVRITPDGLVTRGDNADPDPYIVPVSTVLGVIRTRDRDGNTRAVKGGMAGRAVASCCAMYRLGQRAVHRPAVRLYRFAVDRRIISRWLFPRLDLQLARFVRDGGEELQLLHRGRAVGVLRPGADRWTIAFPYALVVDVEGLPAAPAGATGAPIACRQDLQV